MFQQTLYADVLILESTKSALEFCNENPALEWKTDRLEVKTGGFFYLDKERVPKAVQFHFKKGYTWTCFSLQEDLYMASLINSAVLSMKKSKKISNRLGESIVKEFLMDAGYHQLWFQLIRFCGRRRD